MNKLNEEEQQILLKVAKDAITHRFDNTVAPKGHGIKYEDELQDEGACFVTLKYKGKLRGCIGTLEAYRPLLEDVVGNAISAAFFDPRFSPVSEVEWPDIEISISVLSPREKLEVSSEEDLLGKLRPGIDGLVISSDWRRATFLPAVWEELPKPKEFLLALKEKAGFKQDEWPEEMEVERYTSQSF